MQTHFTYKDILSLKEAIRYQQARKGTFSSIDPVAQLSGRLHYDNDADLKFSEFTNVELCLMLEVIDENIKFLNNYDYRGLSPDRAKLNKDRILQPLYSLKKKLITNVQ